MLKQRNSIIINTTSIVNVTTPELAKLTSYKTDQKSHCNEAVIARGIRVQYWTCSVPKFFAWPGGVQASSTCLYTFPGECVCEQSAHKGNLHVHNITPLSSRLDLHFHSRIASLKGGGNLGTTLHLRNLMPSNDVPLICLQGDISHSTILRSRKNTHVHSILIATSFLDANFIITVSYTVFYRVSIVKNVPFVHIFLIL